MVYHNIFGNCRILSIENQNDLQEKKMNPTKNELLLLLLLFFSSIIIILYVENTGNVENAENSENV